VLGMMGRHAGAFGNNPALDGRGISGSVAWMERFVWRVDGDGRGGYST
jgi:hypothetical protein